MKTEIAVNRILIALFMVACAVLIYERGGALQMPRSVIWMVLIIIVAFQSLIAIITGRRLYRTKTDFIMFFLALSGLLATLTSISVERSWPELNTLIVFILSFIFIREASSEENNPRFISDLIVAIGFSFSAYWLFLAANGAPGSIFIEESRIRLLGPFGYANMFAVFLAMIIPLAIYRVAIVPSLLRRILLTCVASTMMIALLLTYSRGGIIVGIVSLFLLLLLAPNPIKAPCLSSMLAAGMPVILMSSRIGASAFMSSNPESAVGYASFWSITILVLLTVSISSWLLIVISAAPFFRGGKYFAIALIFIYLGEIIFLSQGAVISQKTAIEEPMKTNSVHAEKESTQTPVENLINLGDSQQPQRQDRTWLWALSLKMLKEKPLLGSGLGTWSLGFMRLRDRARDAADPHDLYLRWLAEAGIAGFIALLMVMIYFIFIMIKSIIEPTYIQESSHAPAFIAGGLGFLFHAGIDTEWNFPALMLLFFIYLGVVSASVRIKSGNQKRRPELILIACAIVFVSVLMPYLSERELAIGNEKTAKLQWNNAKNSFIKSMKFNPYSATARARSGELYQALFHVENDPKYLTLASERYAEALGLDRENAARYISYGDFVNDEQHDRRKAIQYYLKAIEFDDLNPIPYLRLKDIYASTGDFEKAKQAELDGNHRNWMWSLVLAR